jgi:replicative DNA helicase
MSSSSDMIDPAAATAHDEGAEKAVIGIMLLDADATSEVRRRIKVEDFYKPLHQSIFAAACRLDDSRNPVEPQAILSELTRSSEIKNSSEAAVYITELFSNAPAPASLQYYVGLVKDTATRRGLSAVGMRMQQMAAVNGVENPAEIVERMRKTLDDLAVDRLGADIPMVDEIVASTLEEIDALTKGTVIAGISTGFNEVDEALNGLRPGQMIVVAARPGMGKTAFALDIVRHAAFRQKKSVMMFSLEMSRNELMMRALSGEAYVDLHALKTGDLDDHKWQQLSTATSRMYGSKFGVDDNASITMTDIRAKARAFQRIHGLDLVVIDYIQLMNSDGRSDSRQQEVSEISRGVKLLAKEFGIPVIALSQLNRGSESRQDKKPVISDLRESGAIEQDADVVILLHREEVYEKETPRAGEADIIIAKQRSGPTGTVILSWLGKYSRFDNRTIVG